MSTPSSDRLVAELVLDHPAAAPALEALGIDTCCQATRPLGEACRAAGVAAARALDAIDRADAKARPEETLLSRVEALVAGHRDLRRAIDRVEALGRIVARTHSGLDPALGGVVRDLLAVREQIDAHAAAEEAALFARVMSAPPREELCDERARVDELRRDLRALANDYAATPHACPTAQALLVEVRALEEALAEHMARQRALEAALGRTS